MSIADKLTTVAENQQKVYEAGRKAEYDRFWDSLQNFGNKTNYSEAFRDAGWNDETFKPKYSMNPEGVSNMFSNCRITNLKALLNSLGINLDFSGITYNRVSQTFSYSTITDLGVLDMSSCTKLDYFLWNALKLVNIDKFVLSSNGTTVFTNTTFQNCSALENVTFEGVIKSGGLDMHWSKKLSADSLKSIINCLSADAVGLTVTLPTTAQANYDAVYGEGAWAELTATKSNWTISLSE